MHIGRSFNRWQRLDAAALALELQIEQRLDAFGDGAGSPPSPVLFAISAALRSRADRDLCRVWHAFRRARRNMVVL